MEHQDYYTVSGVMEACHAVKQSEDPALRSRAARKIASYLEEAFGIDADCILVPAPQHVGYAVYTRDIADIIAEHTGAVVADVLRCTPGESRYESKKAGRQCAAPSMYAAGLIGQAAGKRVLFIENVISTGATFLAAKRVVEGVYGCILEPAAYAVDYIHLKDPEVLSLLDQQGKRNRAEDAPPPGLV